MTNSKVLTLAFALSGALFGFMVALMLAFFAGIFGFVARMVSLDVVRHGLPVISGLVLFSILQFNPKVLLWGEEVVQEVRRIVWPSQKDMTAMTIVVIIMVLISSTVVAVFDFISGYMISGLMRH